MCFEYLFHCRLAYVNIDVNISSYTMLKNKILYLLFLSYYLLASFTNTILSFQLLVFNLLLNNKNFNFYL